mgnify:CR=1 FL=1
MAIMDDKKNLAKATLHNIILENREKLSVSGVEDVESFDEESIVLYTQMGVLMVRGIHMRINKFNVDSGELVIEGDIDKIEYSDSGPKQKGGLFSRMFK